MKLVCPLACHCESPCFLTAQKRELYVPPAPPDDEDSLFATITTGINFDKYDEIPVEVTGRDAPRNITSFDECGFFETTSRSIQKCNYTKPTPVQKYAIPIVMQGRDLMACAQTGSGKTVSWGSSWRGFSPCRDSQLSRAGTEVCLL